VHQFYAEHKLTLPSYLDPGHQVAELYKVYKYPETFLIDGNGYVVKHTWQEDWASPRAISVVEDLLHKAETKDQTLLR
jgi:peroxiredoxin